uniref:Replication initiator protein n=3 Tax=unclassified Microvirus TaxID=338099 RepID=A0AAU8B149_9VIRU
MSCYHPLKAWPIGLTEAGKTKYKITSYDVHHLEMRNGIWNTCTTELLSPYRDKSVMDFVEIPCGKCIGCRLEYSRQWANRCMLELQYHQSAYFVTLTYNDEHVPVSYYDDPETGEAFPSLTLRKRDFQLFMKRLRKRFCKYGSRTVGELSLSSGIYSDSIRFFAAGEYGSETYRPHYHAILFGLELNDLILYKKSRGFSYYYSLSLQECWSEYVSGCYLPLGYVVVAPVTWETCAYVARYTMKKLTGPETDFYTQFNIEPPFSLMSRKPGIGRQWYDDHPDCMSVEYINVSTSDGGRKFRPPKYYEKLYEIEYPEKSAALKATRKRMAEEAKKFKLSKTTLNYMDYLQVEEDCLEGRIKSLERKL